MFIKVLAKLLYELSFFNLRLNFYFFNLCFFRKMKNFEIDTPVLLIINDMNGHTFGGIASTKFFPSVHHYGIGYSSKLFRFINNDEM